MFKQKTILHIKDLPNEFVDAIDFIVDFSYSTYTEISPWAVLYVDLNDPKPIHERRIVSWEEFKHYSLDREYYDFLVWCVNQGQREPFLLISW